MAVIRQSSSTQTKQPSISRQLSQVTDHTGMLSHQETPAHTRVLSGEIILFTKSVDRFKKKDRAPQIQSASGTLIKWCCFMRIPSAKTMTTKWFNGFRKAPTQTFHSANVTTTALNMSSVTSSNMSRSSKLSKAAAPCSQATAQPKKSQRANLNLTYGDQILM